MDEQDNFRLAITPENLPAILEKPWLLLPVSLHDLFLDSWLSHKHIDGLRESCLPLAMAVFHYWDRKFYEEEGGDLIDTVGGYEYAHSYVAGVLYDFSRSTYDSLAEILKYWRDDDEEE